jgi:hypothetical protein
LVEIYGWRASVRIRNVDARFITLPTLRRSRAIGLDKSAALEVALPGFEIFDVAFD